MQLIRILKRPVSAFWTAQVVLYGCALGLAGMSSAQVPTRFPVMPEQVRLAMQKRDWPSAGVQIRLATPITATVAQPMLEIASVTSQSGHQALLRMACRIRTECLPFYASAAWPAEAPMPELLPETGERSISALSGHAAKAQAGEFPVLLTGSSSAGAVPEPTAIRIGSSATLILEGERIHIRLPVILAQSGHVGDTVRVTTPDRKQVYVAEVLSSGLLKGDINP